VRGSGVGADEELSTHCGKGAGLAEHDAFGLMVKHDTKMEYCQCIVAVMSIVAVQVSKCGITNGGRGEGERERGREREREREREVRGKDRRGIINLNKHCVPITPLDIRYTLYARRGIS
jgi:hypothetical protein